ncbi:MAG: cold shock domain-containing protein [Candidatus Thermoplasmatota archaeon]|nr:cold shock domain-containing protein [Candidatus Thermoplasmatota archaeon]
MKGTLKFFDEKKGYGFIEPDGDEEDHFVHRTELQEGVSLEEGDRVEFDSELGDRGFKALNVKKIEG